MAVGEHLHLDVARVVQVALEVDGRVGEELLAFAARALEGPSSSSSESATRKPLPPPPPAALTATGKPISSPGDPRASATVSTGSVVPGHDRHARLLHQLARARLRAHRLDRARRRADEHDPGLLAGLRERRVLGEEAVARVDRLARPRAPRDVEDLLDAQVVLRGGPAAEVVGLVGARDVRRVAVELGVDGDARDAQLLERADDANRDLAAVGDQDLREHRRGA